MMDSDGCSGSREREQVLRQRSEALRVPLDEHLAALGSNAEPVSGHPIGEIQPGLGTVGTDVHFVPHPRSVAEAPSARLASATTALQALICASAHE